MAEQQLKQMGYQVMTSNDSAHALNIFLDNKDDFDLVITDMIMPKMTGKTLSQKIHKLKPDIPIILCSGYSDDIDPDTIQKIGVTQYLMKPIGMNDLARAVKDALQKKT